jgi:hypothetical protein
LQIEDGDRIVLPLQFFAFILLKVRHSSRYKSQNLSIFIRYNQVSPT